MVFGVRSLARSKRCSMSLYIMFKLVSDAVMISLDFSHVLTKMSSQKALLDIWPCYPVDCISARRK